MKRLLVLSLVGGLSMAGCTTPGQNTGIGAGIGAVAGAAAGALMGGKNRGKGAAIGAAAGLLLGGGVGNYLDKQKAELEKVAETKRTEHGLVTKLKGDILFESGKTNLTPEAEKRISEIARIIAKYPEDRLTVVGHTDSTGSLSLNERLSRERAAAVMQVIVSNGVPSQFINAKGVGPSQPIATNKTTMGRSQNRRVEIQIVVDETALKKKG